MISSVFRTLRMIRNFGDGDQFSQKRLRAPQDVGLGRRKKFNSSNNNNNQHKTFNTGNHIFRYKNEEEKKSKEVANNGISVFQVKNDDKPLPETQESFSGNTNLVIQVCCGGPLIMLNQQINCSNV